MTETRASVPARHVAAVVVGNALEFYDFLTYAFFAVYIGRAFFPSNAPSASLLASLGTFGVGFVTRPIGGLVIGRMGDRLGRKPAMILSFSLMGIAITGLALTPPHSMIGIAAPLLVIFFRMLQGFALGGEVGPTTAFLLEAAPPERRGFYTAFQSWTQDLSILISGLVGFGLANTLSEQQLQDFGWRIAFLVGAAIVPFGLMMRRSLPETFHAPDGGKRERVSLRPHLSVAVLGVMLLASATIGSYITRLHDDLCDRDVAHACKCRLCGDGCGRPMRRCLRSCERRAVGPHRPQTDDARTRRPVARVDSSGLLRDLALSHDGHIAGGDRRVVEFGGAVRMPDHHLADRISSGGDPLRWRRHCLRRFNRDVRRHDSIRRYLAH